MKKKRYYDSYFKRHTHDIKKVWNGIKSIVTLKSKSKTSPKSLNIDGNCITNEKIIAENFNNFFVEIGSNLASKIPKAKKPFNVYLKNKLVNSFVLNPVDESEVVKLVNNINKNKSLGPNSIPISVLKRHIDVLKGPITFLINLSFRQGIFPDALKNAKVTPVFKVYNKYQGPKIVAPFHLLLVLQNLDDFKI